MTIIGYVMLRKRIDWQSIKHGASLAIVNLWWALPECPQWDSKIVRSGIED